MAGILQAEQRKKILEGLADGKSLRTICKASGMPAISTVMEWCLKDKDWSEHYAHARATGDDAMAEDIQAIADNSELDHNDRKVRIDARKWLLAKRQPKKYGDAMLHKHADADGEKVKLDEVGVVTRIAAILAKARDVGHEDA